MLISMLLLDLLSFPLLSPVLDLMGILQFGVFFPLLISNCASTIPSLLVKVFPQCWILLPGFSFVLFPTGKFQLVLGKLLPRLPLCASSEFPAFRCCRFLLVLVLLGTALARQILFLPLFLFPMRPLFYPPLLSPSLPPHRLLLPLTESFLFL